MKGLLCFLGWVMDRNPTFPIKSVVDLDSYILLFSGSHLWRFFRKSLLLERSRNMEILSETIIFTNTCSTSSWQAFLTYSPSGLIKTSSVFVSWSQHALIIDHLRLFVLMEIRFMISLVVRSFFSISFASSFPIDFSLVSSGHL